MIVTRIKTESASAREWGEAEGARPPPLLPIVVVIVSCSFISSAGAALYAVHQGWMAMGHGSSTAMVPTAQRNNLPTRSSGCPRQENEELNQSFTDSIKSGESNF